MLTVLVKGTVKVFSYFRDVFLALVSDGKVYLKENYEGDEDDDEPKELDYEIVQNK